MKLLFIPFLAFLTAFGALNISKKKTTQAQNTDSYKLKNYIRCSPDWQALEAYLEDADIPPMPGAGIYKWNIHSKSDSAQFYFNQGINMYYGFHIVESMASFIKASKFDAANPMIWWAQALAYGPNINDVEYNATPRAVDAAKKAKALSVNSSPFEKSLINAMLVRYSLDTASQREVLNQRYTSAMKNVYLQYPSFADAGALYVDAMMLEHPWQLWKVDGTPYPWTPQIRTVLEKTLTKNPEHPGANHYYIHVMEPSPFPQKALASANRMGRLNPGLSHLVHMPSHIYLRTGYYKTGYTVNEEAVKQYKSYLSLYPGVLTSEFLYRLHNEHMLVNCAMHAGRKKYSIDAALALQKSFDSSYLSAAGGMGNYLQYMYMIPALVMIRFEDWDGLLNAATIDSARVYANLLWHFGKGMALTARNDLSAARRELATIELLLKDSSLFASYAPFSPAIDGAVVAAHLLKGTIALQDNKATEAIPDFKIAAEREKNMVYNEPRDWLLNPKNYLANAYLIAGNYKEAKKTFLLDLKDNNENAWSLSGLYKVLLKQNNKKEAASVLMRLKKACSDSDIDLIR